MGRQYATRVDCVKRTSPRGNDTDMSEIDKVTLADTLTQFSEHSERRTVAQCNDHGIIVVTLHEGEIFLHAGRCRGYFARCRPVGAVHGQQGAGQLGCHHVGRARLHHNRPGASALSRPG